MPVSLTTAAPGDRFAARDGEPAPCTAKRPAWSKDWYGYSVLFQAIAAAAKLEWGGTAISISVEAFENAMIASTLDSPAPAQAEPMGDVGLVDLLKRLRSPLPVCPYDRRSPDYWTTPDDQPCVVCRGTNEGPDRCRGADTRCMEEAATYIEALLLRATKAEAALNEARKAALYVLPYLRFTVGPESPGHHPTMPSAVVAFQEAFGLSTEEARLEAARDWHSKHGGSNG